MMGEINERMIGWAWSHEIVEMVNWLSKVIRISWQEVKYMNLAWYTKREERVWEADDE